MFQDIPGKKPGERLSAEHVNTLSRIAGDYDGSTLSPGAYATGLGGRRAGFPPFMQRRVIVVSEEWDVGEAGGAPGLYEIRFRYFSGTDLITDTADESSSSSSSSSSGTEEHAEGWQTDDEGDPYFLDARDSGDVFAAGDKLTAYWDAQRGMWIPASAPGGSGVLLVRSVGSISKGSLGQLTKYNPPQAQLGPTSIYSAGGWTGSITDLTDGLDTTYLFTTGLNNAVFLRLADVPSSFINAVQCAITLRCWRANDMKMGFVRVYKQDGTTPLTESVRIYDDTFIQNRTVFPQITGGTTYTDWRNPILRISSDSFGSVGQVNIASATVIVYHDGQPSRTILGYARLWDVSARALCLVTKAHSDLLALESGGPNNNEAYYEIINSERIV